MSRKNQQPEAVSDLEDDHVLDSSDVAYSVLSDTRRRYTIHYLKQQGEPVSIRELSEQVAAWENDKSVSELTSKERKRVYIALYQSHLNTLDAEGIVDYDADAGMVELADAFGEFDIYLEVVSRGNVPWSFYYLGLTTLNGLILLFAWYEIRPFTLLPDLAWAGIVLATFAVSAFVQLYESRRMRLGDDGPPPELQANN